MDRAAFMEQLEKMLADISPSEREEALDYYESYFDDAGEDKEDQVIRELGSPGKVAAIIKDDLRENGASHGAYTERGYEDPREREELQYPQRFGTSEEKEAEGPDTYEYGEGSWGETEEDRRRREREERKASRAQRGGYHPKSRRGGGTAVLILILLVFCAPFLKGVLGGVLGAVVGIALLPFLLILGLGVVVLGLGAGGFACVASGIALCATSFASGVLTMGVGFLLMAVTCICLLLLTWIAGRLVPGMMRRFTDFCNRILNRRGKGAGEV